MTQVDQKLKSLIMESSYMNLTQEDIRDSSDLIADFGFDSVSIMKFIVDVENTFEIQLEDDELVFHIIAHYGNLKNCVQQKLLCKERG